MNTSAKDSTDSHELHGVQPVLFVQDVEVTLAYYRDTLGFHVDFAHGSPPVHARVSSGERQGPSAARVRFQLAQDPQPVERSCYLYVHVGRKLDELLEAYRSRGVEIVGEPQDRPWGLREFQVRDCNGYLLTFATEVGGAA